MKLRLLKDKHKAKFKPDAAPAKAGRKSSLTDARRFCFFLPDKEKQDIQEFIDEALQLDSQLKYSFAYVFREGARLLMRRERLQMKLATKGKLHAKSREPNQPKSRLPISRE